MLLPITRYLSITGCCASFPTTDSVRYFQTYLLTFHKQILLLDSLELCIINLTFRHSIDFYLICSYRYPNKNIEMIHIF